jgi:hypothetical protein
LTLYPGKRPADTDWGFHEKELAAIQALIRQHPQDLFVQRYYIWAMGEPAERRKVIDEYKEKVARSGGDAQMAYLHGVTLIGRQSAESIKVFEGALQKDAKFAWPHLGLVELLRRSPISLSK